MVIKNPDDWRRIGLLKRTFERPPRRRPAIVTQFFRGSGGETDIVATHQCELACLTATLKPEDTVVMRERLDALEIVAQRERGKLVVYSSSGREIDGETFESSDILISDLAAHEDALLSSLQEGWAWLMHWVRLQRSTSYAGAVNPFVLTDCVDPVFGLQPVAMSRQSAAGIGIPFLPVTHRGGPISINGAISQIGSGIFRAHPRPYGGLWQVERARPGKPAECVYRAVGLFRPYAGQ